MKQFLLATFAVVLFLRCSAQDAAEFQSIIAVSTIAPEAASIGKFGNIPVGYATGVPSVTIPLYEINIGKIKIPLSLDYHGGGVRVDEVSSSIGTSWALNGIGIMSRNMIGLPDENSGSGYLSAPSFDSLYNYYYGAVYGPVKDQNFSTFMYHVRDNEAETEPDVFSYTLNGESGKFIYRPDGSIMQIPVTNNRIEKIAAGGDNNFKITDQSGMVYIFDQQEQTQMVSAGANGPGTYVSAWRLSKLIDPSLADTVYFKYTSAFGGAEHTWNFSTTLGGTDLDSPYGIENSNSISTISHTVELFPNEIDWRGGKVTFANAMDRTDRTSELRLDSVKVYSKQNGTYQLIKNIKLYQSYFYSNPIPGATPDNRNYRLRLDSVAYLPVNSTLPPQKYIMTYNNTPIAPNESFGQDIWGFNNGQYSNTSLMPKQSVLWGSAGIYQTIGDANMDADSTNTYVEACMLQSIKYPTKGTSVFTFEPHRYPWNFNATQQQSVICNAFGGTAGVRPVDTVYFTVGPNQTGFSYTGTISAYNFPSNQAVISNPPDISIYDQTTGQRVIWINNPTQPQNEQTFNTPTTEYNFVFGHTYMIITNIYTTDPRISASCTVSWSAPYNGTLIKSGGGLRVSSITNYDNNGSFINKETYQYGNNGVGTLLTDEVYLLVNYENIFYAQGKYVEPQYPCFQYYSHPDTRYLSKSVYPASQFSGSPVVYGGVVKYDTDNLGNTNGKSVFGYTVFGDVAGDAIIDYGQLGVWLISNPWKNGILNYEATYKSNGTGYTPVNIKQYNYKVYRADTLLGLKIKPLFVQMSGCEVYGDTTLTRIGGGIDNYNSNYIHFFEDRIPTYSGAMLLQNESDTTYDNAGNKTVIVKNNYYDNPVNTLTTRKETFSSKGDDLVDVMKYPQDVAATGNVYQTMVNRNMIAPIVSYQEQKNGNQLTLSNINYNDWFNNGTLLLPETVSEQVLANAAETRVSYDKYDQYGNILQQEKTGAPHTSYQWGYNSQYPVATVKNALNTDIFYDSFEEGDGKSTAGDAKTGHYSHTGTYTENLTGLDNGNYILSYWQESAGVWSLVSTNITVTGGSYQISLSTQVDDIRFYPATAQMATFTYDPLIGMTSATDPKNEVTYYEYDGFQRLMNIRDKDKNVIKHLDYHYRGQ